MRRAGAAILVAAVVMAIAGCAAAAATATPAPGPASGVPPTSMTITAKDFALTPSTLGAPAGSPLQVHFANQDAGVPHNLTLSGGPGFGAELFKSEIEAGVASDDFQIPGLVPGAYRFSCSVHPTMTADLTVGN